MTAPVRGAAPSTVDQLLQSVRTQVGSHRATAKQSQDGDDKPEEAANDTSKTEAASSDNTVRRRDKVSGRHQSKSDKDEDDTSFEETFDTIGKQDPNSNGTSARSDNWPGNTMVAPVAGNSPVQQTPDIVKQPSDNSQRAVRPGNLLRQDSIAALIDAKARLVPNDDNTKLMQAAQADVAQPAQAQRDEIGDATPAVVNSQETHWNFAETTVAAAAAQLSRLQPEARATPHPFASAPFSSSRLSTVLQKTSEPAAKTTNESAPQLQAQAVQAPAADTAADSFLANRDQSGARLQQQATGDVADGKAVKTDASDSIDQSLTIDPKPTQQTQPSVSAQVRNGVVDALAGKAGELAPNTTATDIQDRPSTPTPVMRSLDLTLSPPDLGSVRLRLSLKSNSLAIEAETSKAATAKILNDDRTSLERGLKDAGYDVTSLKITETSSSNSTTSNGQTSGSPFRDGDQARSNFAGRQDGDAQRRDGSLPDQSQRRQKDDAKQTSAGGDLQSGRQSNALYI